MQLYSEFVAAAILPFCFLFATRLVRNNGIDSVIGFAVSCSLLVLTHIPATIVGMTGLLTYIAVLVDWRNYRTIVPRFILGGTLALGGAAFYLVRLLLEVDWVKHSTPEYSTGFYTYNRFLFPVIASFGELYREHSLLRLDTAILLTVLFFVPIVTAIDFRKRNRMLSDFEQRVVLGLTAAGLISVFMLTVLSRFVWDAIPVLHQLQFPFRFLTVASMIAAILFPLAIAMTRDSQRPAAKLVLAFSMALIAGTIAFDVTKVVFSSTPMSREDFYITMVDVREAEGCTCWWPRWGEPKALENRRPVTMNSRDAAIQGWDAEIRQVRVGSGASENLRLATYYYPYWKADIDGKETPLTMDDGGAIVLPIPPEEALVTFRFEEPAVYRSAKWISAVTWIGLWLGAAYWVIAIARMKKRTSG
jgi:hypothetical protein